MVVTDILIIGAGIAGASLGYRLAEHCNVTILEAEQQPGFHATGRSAALYTATYGHPVIRELTLHSRRFFDAPPMGFADVPLMHRRGALWIAREDQLARLSTHYREAAALDPTIRACSLDAALELCSVLRRDYVAGAIEEPNACDIDVHALHQGYLRAFKAHGGRLETNARVETLRPHANGWEVVAGRETYSCRLVVNAAGAWADEIAAMAGAIPVGLTPKRRTAITFAPPAGSNVGGWPCVLDLDEEFYFRPDAGRILGSPADEAPSAPCDAQPEEIDIAIAVDRIERATNLTIPRILAKWAGLRTFAPDKVPVVGADPDVKNFFWLAGQGGYGIMTSPALSEFAAALILERPVPLALLECGIRVEALDPVRFRGAQVEKQARRADGM